METNKLPIERPIDTYPHGQSNSNNPYPPPFKERALWRHSPRFRIFLITTLLFALPGLIFDFSRPAIFSSSTVLLTVTPDKIGAEIVDPSLQHALIQKNLLSARKTLDNTLKQLHLEGFSKQHLPNSSAEFQKMLSVKPLEATNLVEVSAEGYNAEILPILLNSLSSTYAQSRRDTIEQAVTETSSALIEQQLSLEKQVVSKRRELEEFRANNNILTLGRDENEVYARLKGLTEALNTALEKRVTAKAELDAMQAAAAQGKTLIAPSDERAFSDLQMQQRKLQEKLTELDNKYTRDYMALHPEMKIIPEQLATINKIIAEKVSAGKSLVLTTASRIYQAAKNAEYALQRQLDDYRQTALTFSNSFSIHEAKQEELIQLEEHSRAIQQSITELHIEQQQKYPQIDVIEPAYLSSASVRPYYWRDAGIIAACSLLLGLLAIWLSEFLRRSQPQDQDYRPAPDYVTVLDPRLMATSGRLISQSQLSRQLPGEAVPSLEQTTNDPLSHKNATAPFRDLNETELQQLLRAADLPAQQLIGLLLSGVRPEELGAMTAENFASAEQDSKLRLALNTPEPRVLSIPSTLQKLLKKTQGCPQWLNADEGTDAKYFNAILNCAAIDAGLDEPSAIDCNCLHQNYIYFLVRSGIKLSELANIVGRLSPLQLTQYGQLSPSGPGLPAEDIVTSHPALQTL